MPASGVGARRRRRGGRAPARAARGPLRALHRARGATSSAARRSAGSRSSGSTCTSSAAGSTRRAWTHVDGDGERTITVLGDKLLPRGPLPLEGYDLVFFVSGDAEALRSARKARFVAATMRELPMLARGRCPARSDGRQRERPARAVRRHARVGMVVLTDGADGGTANGERFDAAPRRPVVDTYGAGDSFGRGARVRARAWRHAAGRAAARCARRLRRCSRAVARTPRS